MPIRFIKIPHGNAELLKNQICWKTRTAPCPLKDPESGMHCIEKGIPPRTPLLVSYRLSWDRTLRSAFRMLSSLSTHNIVAVSGFILASGERIGRNGIGVATSGFLCQVTLSATNRQVRSPVHQQSTSLTLNSRPEKCSRSPAINPSS